MKSRRRLIIGGIISTFLLCSSGIAIAANSDLLSSKTDEDQFLLQPNSLEESKVTVSDATYNTPVTFFDVTTPDNVETKLNKASLKTLGIKLDKPTSGKAILSEKSAIEKAESNQQKFASEAKDVSSELQLLTYPYLNAFSESALSKNPKLKAEGFLNQTPVYIVTFKGINGVGHAAVGDKVPTYNEYNVVIDAVSGEVLFSFTYQ
ncbi:PepSY domain-containing protein [Paenibacillus durus]|uniref:Uncharacterized protein n=1 Tax=Paenibacillus durus TaxID=44251 RepID=A0A089HJ06_PAEDU|nr:PepSY domain-containing protein [Paenibacillus durus]AIQ11906.1 hypothetical protein PDUR_08135 [Paenibacillus durus]